MANENPSKKVNLEIQSSDQPGVIDAVEQVTDTRPWSVGGVIDNSGYESSGRTHVTAQYQNFDLGGLDHTFSAQYTTSTEDPSKLRVYGAGYHIPIYGYADSLDFYGTYSTINSGTVAAGLLDLQVSGAGAVFGVHFNHDLPRIGHYDSQLVLGLDRKEFRDDIDFQGAATRWRCDRRPHQPVLCRAMGDTRGRLSTSISPGSATFPGARRPATPISQRHGRARRLRTASSAMAPDSTDPWRHDWQLRLTVNGQETHDALVPGEQFGIGGATSVRGLLEREIENDKGFTANAEIHTPNLCGAIHDGLTLCNALTFFDDGRADRNDALPGEETHQSVNSAGVGFRLTRGRFLTLQMDYGHVVSASDPQQRGAQRLHAMLAVAY